MGRRPLGRFSSWCRRIDSGSLGMAVSARPRPFQGLWHATYRRALDRRLGARGLLRLGPGARRLSAPSPCLYRVTVPVNVERTGELGSGPYTASLFPSPPSPSYSPVPLTIVHTPFCGV